MGAVQKPWGIFNVLSFGALLVLLVTGDTGLFLALMTLKLLAGCAATGLRPVSAGQSPATTTFSSIRQREPCFLRSK